MTAHSIVAPSSAHRWVLCHGAPVMEQLCPEEDTQDARDGRAAHWLAEQALLQWYENGDNNAPAVLPFYDVDPAGTAISDDVRESAEMYVEDVVFTAVRCQSNWNLEVEWGLQIPRIHHECFGTLDAALITAEKITLWDFKHGHEEVSPVWNWQMLCYLAGVLDALQVDGNRDQFLQVEFRIVQPRCYTSRGPIRNFMFTASDARGYFNQLSHAAQLATSSDPQTNPGSQCKHCSARYACPSLRKAAYFSADYVGSALPEHLTGEGLAFELALLDYCDTMMKSRYEAIQTEARARAEKGESIPGFLLEPNFGHRQWRDKNSAILLGQMFGVDLHKPAEPLTPNQATKKLKPLGANDDIINQYVTRPALPAKLIPAKDSDAPRILNN